MGQMETQWVTTPEASRLTGYAQAYLRRLARDQWVRARKDGGRWLFDREVLQDHRDGWIGIHEARMLTDYSEAHLRRLAREGRVKARKVQQFWLFHQRSLLDYCRFQGRG